MKSNTKINAIAFSLLLFASPASTSQAGITLGTPGGGSDTWGYDAGQTAGSLKLLDGPLYLGDSGAYLSWLNGWLWTPELQASSLGAYGLGAEFGTVNHLAAGGYAADQPSGLNSFVIGTGYYQYPAASVYQTAMLVKRAQAGVNGGLGSVEFKVPVTVSSPLSISGAVTAGSVNLGGGATITQLNGQLQLNGTGIHSGTSPIGTWGNLSGGSISGGVATITGTSTFGGLVTASGGINAGASNITTTSGSISTGTGTATFGGAVTATAGLNTNAGNISTTTGSITTGSGTATFGGLLTASGGMVTSGNVTSGTATVNSTSTFNGLITANAGITTGAASQVIIGTAGNATAGLTVNGNATITGNTTISGALSFTAPGDIKNYAP
jgi:hypothetical protein